MKRKAIYAALDLPSNSCVLGRMDHECRSLGATRFATRAETLKEHIGGLAKKHRGRVHLTVGSGATEPLGGRDRAAAGGSGWSFASRDTTA